MKVVDLEKSVLDARRNSLRQLNKTHLIYVNTVKFLALPSFRVKSEHVPLLL